MRNAVGLVVTVLLVSETPRLEAQITETNSFTNLNKPIPDGNAAGLHDVRIVSSAIVNLSSVRLNLHVTGEFNGDLYSYVRHIQGGTTNFCVLLNRVGRTLTNSAGYADSGLDVVLDDAAGQGDIHMYRAVTNLPIGMSLTGTWQPDGRKVDTDAVLDITPRTTTLSSFTTTSASGEWTLYLADLASGGTNLLADWALELTGIARPTVTWPTPADIVYGTALGPSQLNASSPVAGAFSYTPPASTVLNAGSNLALSVTFTPTDTNSYVSVTTNVSINVLKKALAIMATSTNKVYGAPLPALTAIYSGFLNGDTTNNLSAQAMLSTSATAASPVGSYPITASGASNSNYTISYVAGTLAITKAGTLGSLGSSMNPSPPNQSVAFTFTLNAVAPGAGTPTGTVQFKIDGANASGPVSLGGGVASYTTSTLAHGTHTVVAEYAGDGNFTGTTNLLSPDQFQLINSQPVAGPDNIQRDPTNGVKVSIATLLSNDSDADGDPLTFLADSTNSANGGAVARSGGWLFYSPAPGFTNTDTFTYAITDGLGAPVTGVVTVNIRVDNGPSPNLAITDLGNSSYSIRGDGIPGRTYRIEFAPEAAPTNWQTLGMAPADMNGLFQFTDSSGSPQRFYRSVFP
jgi:subtilisin-like proprotein convertase family protein